MWVLMRSQVTARSRFTEDCLTEAAAAGVRQYVVLGAGLDTFAYRQSPWAKDLRIFEVDHPATQDDKRAHLAELPPATGIVSFGSMGFERESLGTVLDRAEHDRQHAQDHQREVLRHPAIPSPRRGCCRRICRGGGAASTT